MAITFENTDSNYYIVNAKGVITDDLMLQAWSDFLYSKQWAPGLNELSDLTDADLTRITSAGLKQLADFSNTFYRSNNIPEVRVAVYAPTHYLYGITRMYKAMTFDSPEQVELFRDKKDAVLWLQEGAENPNSICNSEKYLYGHQQVFFPADYH